VEAPAFRPVTKGMATAGVLAPEIGIVKHPMVEELEQEFSALRDKVHDLQEYL